jgi:hypothetical protein
MTNNVPNKDSFGSITRVEWVRVESVCRKPDHPHDRRICGLAGEPEVAFHSGQNKKENMKKLQIAILTVGLTVALSASAQIYTYSGSDFNNNALVGSYNGTYVSAPSGHMNLAYTDPSDDAVVGAKGPFGTLNNNDLSMSFDYSNLIGGNGNQPYAAFGLSTDGTWGGSGQYYLVIAMSGNQLNGATPIHVFDSTHNVDTSVTWGSTMASILGDIDTYSGGLTFGDMQVMRAYAYIGDWPGVGNVSVDVNSITVTSVPEPTTLTMIAGGMLLLICSRITLRKLRKNRAA